MSGAPVMGDGPPLPLKPVAAEFFGTMCVRYGGAMPRDEIGRDLSDVAKAVFSALLRQGEATRRSLATEAEVSFPTVTAALAELDGLSFVEELRREQGARGRATIVYGASRRAGWVLGLDIGSTQVSFLAQSLKGEVLERGSVPHHGDVRLSATLAGKIAADFLKLRPKEGRPLVVALALNQIVPRHLESRAPDSPRPVALDVIEHFSASARIDPAVPLLVENNVNCAAVAEHHDGMMQGIDDAAYMQIGVGIGLGFFSDGALIRGGYGASGELAQIPLSWSADVESPRNAIEMAYGSTGLIDAARQAWSEKDTAPQSAEALFAKAEAGNVVAHALMRRQAAALGRIAAACVTIVDPTVLVIGGGLTRNQTFAGLIIDEFQSRNGRTDIRVSAKGADATVQGVAILARDFALKAMLGPYHQPLLSRPTIWRSGS